MGTGLRTAALHWGQLCSEDVPRETAGGSLRVPKREMPRECQVVTKAWMVGLPLSNIPFPQFTPAEHQAHRPLRQSLHATCPHSVRLSSPRRICSPVEGSAVRASLRHLQHSTYSQLGLVYTSAGAPAACEDEADEDETSLLGRV